MSRAPRRVAITGLGLVAPTGDGFDRFAEALRDGRSAASPVRRFGDAPFPTRFAAQVTAEDRAAAAADAQAAPFLAIDDDKSAWGVLAARRALADARWEPGRIEGASTGVVVGTGLSSVCPGELEEDLLPHLDGEGALDLAAYGRALASRGTPARYSPARHLTDALNRAIAGLAGARGVSRSHFGACAASTQAIGDAFRMVRDGRLEAAIAGGADSMAHPFGMISFMLLGALSTRNDDPAGGCRPFHRDRDGFLLGEGAAMFVLEPLEAARARGATVYAEVAGYGSSVDGYNVTAPRPDGAGAAAAMRAALADAGLRPDAIGYVNAHGTGTGLNDPAEAQAMRTVFGARAAQVPVSSIKPVVGHLVAAAGAIETAACLAAFRHDWLPPTPNLSPDAVDPECAGIDHLFAARDGCPAVLMTNNYGFGGQNASLVLRHAG